jgi:signal transduction histidine kinase
MVSMLFVALIPVALLGIISAGDTQSIITLIGLHYSIFVLTLITLCIVVMWSFFLAKSITSPLEDLSRVATSASRGELVESKIEVLTYDEVGELAIAFNKLLNSYRLLDTLATEDHEEEE